MHGPEVVLAWRPRAYRPGPGLTDSHAGCRWPYRLRHPVVKAALVDPTAHFSVRSAARRTTRGPETLSLTQSCGSLVLSFRSCGPPSPWPSTRRSKVLTPVSDRSPPIARRGLVADTTAARERWRIRPSRSGVVAALRRQTAVDTAPLWAFDVGAERSRTDSNRFASDARSRRRRPWPAAAAARDLDLFYAPRRSR